MTDLFARIAPMLLVAAAFTGCLAADDALQPTLAPADSPVRGTPSLPVYGSFLREEAVVPGAGETRIWLDLYRPEVPEGTKVPVILVMTPYQALGDGFNAVPTLRPSSCRGPLPQDCPYDPDLVEFFVPRGYAVAFSDVRGNHNSGGCVDQTGPAQWQDGYATVEWLGTQAWSNGKVGMYGVSYDGETQTSTALTQPPHLATIVPIASVAGQYDYVYFQGVPYELAGLNTMAGYAAISLLPGQDPRAVPQYPERLSCQKENFDAGLDLSGDMTPYWRDREYRLLAREMQTPVLHVHGLADWNVKPIHIDGWFNEWTDAPVKRAIYGQWNHNIPQRDDWGDEGGILHRWFDHFLLGIDTGLLEDLPPVLIQADPGGCGASSQWRCRSDKGAWRGIDSFPPLESGAHTLHLNPDLTLSATAAEAAEATLHDYPRDELLVDGRPGAIAEGALETAAATAGGAVTGHPTRLVFVSERLETPLHVTGVPTVALTATTDERSTHWAVLLEMVAEDGTAEWMNRGYQDTRHRDGLDAPKDLTPGEEYDLSVRMFPQDDVVPAGMRLRLTLANQDEWVHQDTTFAMSVVKLGSGGAELRLPLDPGGPAFSADSLEALAGQG